MLYYIIKCIDTYVTPIYTWYRAITIKHYSNYLLNWQCLFLFLNEQGPIPQFIYINVNNLAF